MSVETWACLVPRDEQYIPSKESQFLAIQLFYKELFDYEYTEEDHKTEPLFFDQFNSEVYEKLTYFDAGTNDYGSIFCPNCDEPIDFDFLMEWQTEDEDDTVGYKFEARKLLCCGKSCTLRELDYGEYNQGFGHYCLEGIVDSRLPPELISEFERILGCPLRVIYQVL